MNRGEAIPAAPAAAEEELYERLARKVEQQAAVADLGRLALKGTGLPELFAAAAGATNGTLNCRANVGWRPEAICPVPLVESSQIGKTFLAEEPVVVDDLGADPRFASSRHLLEDGIVAAAAVPIRGAHRPIGALAAHTRRRRSFNADDILFLRGVANVVAAASAREAADRARQASEDRLAFLAEASDALTRSLRVDQTLDEVARLVVPRLADWCVIHLAEGGRLVPASVHHVDPHEAERARDVLQRTPVDMEMPYGPPHVLRTGEPELVREVTDELIVASIHDPELWAMMFESHIRSVMNVPLAARGMLGVVSLISTRDERRYGADDLALAVELGRRAAVAIDNARTHDAEQLARGRAERLQTVTARLAAALTPEQVVEIVLREGIEAAGAPAGLVALLESDGSTVRVVAERGYATRTLDGWRTFALDAELPVSEVIRSGAAVFCESVAERNRRFPALAALERPSHALVSLPLIAGGVALGGIALSFGEERDFPVEEQQFLQAVANQCAGALERARLYREHELQRLEAERRAEAARALAFVADGVVLVDPGGVVRLWNDAAERITELPAETVLGRRAADAIGGWRELAARVPIAAAGAELARPQTLPLDVGGRELWLSISGVTFSEGTVFALRDVSEEHTLEQLKSDFIATVSHELRTPLAAVYGAATTLRNRPSLDPDERERFLEMIEEQSIRLSKIVNEILIASRLDTAELSLSLVPVDAAEVAQQVVEVARRGAPAGFEIRLDVADLVPPAVADPDRLRQVLGNLLENAVKYSGTSNVAGLEVTTSNGSVCFVVRDGGIGIPTADRERVFDKFYRVDPSMAGGVSGTGLGLYIVRELVDRMGGKVRVDSEIGEGSSFVVELPPA